MYRLDAIPPINPKNWISLIRTHCMENLFYPFIRSRSRCLTFCAGTFLSIHCFPEMGNSSNHCVCRSIALDAIVLIIQTEFVWAWKLNIIKKRRQMPLHGRKELLKNKVIIVHGVTLHFVMLEKEKHILILSSSWTWTFSVSNNKSVLGLERVLHFLNLIFVISSLFSHCIFFLTLF